MAKAKDDFKIALEGKRYPILMLDNKYHRLMKRIGKSSEIESLEKEIQELIKKQGQLNNDIKNIKKLKAKLMQEIVDFMDDKQKADENKRLIDEANERIEEYEDSLMDLPKEIDLKNKSLLLLVMEKCYSILDEYTDEITQIAQWIEQMRTALKENVVKKQDMEITNVEIYTYMHDILGPDVIDTFDIKYDIEARRQEILDKQKAKKEQLLLKQAAESKKDNN